MRWGDWVERFPWLVQGTTIRNLDLRVFGRSQAPEGGDAWPSLKERLGFPAAALAKQVHGARVLVHDVPGGAFDPATGTGEPSEADGHITWLPGLLLAVTVADCAPLFLVDPRHRAVAVLHAGWRGAASGVLEAGLSAMHHAVGTTPDDVWLHQGPAICGGCYEVGPEVHTALDLPTPPQARPVDIRAVISERARCAGVRTERISISPYCTLEHADFYSHRGGDGGRQVGFIGVRP